jgi:hypothetical protein
MSEPSQQLMMLTEPALASLDAGSSACPGVGAQVSEQKRVAPRVSGGRGLKQDVPGPQPLAQGLSPLE